MVHVPDWLKKPADAEAEAEAEAEPKPVESPAKMRTRQVKLIAKYYQIPFNIAMQRWSALKESGELESVLVRAEAGERSPNALDCPLCGSDMAVRTGKMGEFLGCVQFPRCKGTRPLPGEDKPPSVEDMKIAQERLQIAFDFIKKCGGIEQARRYMSLAMQALRKE